MAGISSNALMKLENKRGFNGNEIQNKEFSDGSGLEVYDFNARTYDQQIGRFIQIDPVTEGQESLTPYHFGANDPISNSDPTGREPEDCCGFSELKSWVSDKMDNFVANTKNEIAWVGDKISSAIDQAGENFNARWDARVDPIHQTIDNPLSIVTGGVLGAEVKAVETAIGLEANGAKMVVNAEIKATIQEVKATASEVKATTAGSKSSLNTSSTSKLSKVEKSTKIESVGGKYTKTTVVRPGKGPGQSRAEYTRYKNQDGKAIRSYKDSYDRGNKFQGRKPTTGDPEKRRPQ